MESTGKYYIPVYNVLEVHISNIVVANPKLVSAVKGEKDDNKDAKWIADLFKLGVVNGSFIPSKDILSKVDGRCKANEEDIINAVSGIDLTPIPKARI